jgi:predicted N-acyltransferase
VLRGYEPVITRSAHFIPNAGFRRAVADFVDEEREAIAAEADWLRRDLPYRSSSSE